MGYISNRAREYSTWAGLAVLLFQAAKYFVAPGWGLLLDGLTVALGGSVVLKKDVGAMDAPMR